MTYRVLTFGGWNLVDPDGQPIDAVQPRSKGSAVLAYLATRPTGEAVGRAELLPLLWPDRAEAEGRRSLRVLLSRLRDDLPDGALGGKGEDRLWLVDPVLTSDVREFRRALEENRPRDALAVYRGPLLEHFHVPDAASFNRWADEQRSRYARNAYQAALQVGEEARTAGELTEAVDAYRRALEIAPLREKGASGLMQALAERGERSAALQFYESFRNRLEEELELSSPAELDQLAERIRSDAGEDGRQRDEEHASPASGRRGVEEPGGGGTERQGRAVLPASTPNTVVLAAVLLVVLAAVAGGLWSWDALRAPTTGGGPAAPRAEGAPPTVAVLPFEAVGGNGQTGPFLRGLRADLVTRLSQISGLRVISETSADRYRDADLDLPAIADSLEARWVLEGTVQQVGDTVQVHAQLIDSETDTHVWADTYRRNRATQHLFGLQRDLTRRIANALELELTPEEERRMESPPTESAAAYELYLQAHGLAYREGIPEGEADLAVRLYRRAIQLDSTFAEAWAGLADLYARQIWAFGYPRSWADSGINAARNAIRYGPDLPVGYVELGDNLGVLGRSDAQIDAYREALRLDPGNAAAINGLHFLLSRTGHLAEAMRWLDRAHRAAPGSAELLRMLVLSNARIGRLEAADGWVEYIRARDPDLLREYQFLETRFDLELFVRNDVAEARRVLEQLGRHAEEEHPLRRGALAIYERDWEEALRVFRRFADDHDLTLGRKGVVSAGPGWAIALDRLGRTAEAKAVARKTLEAVDEAPHGFGQGAERNVQAAISYLVLGDTTRALDRLGEAVDRGYRSLPVVRDAPVFDPLRHRSRFRALMARIDSLVAEERRKVEEEGWGVPPARFLPGN